LLVSTGFLEKKLDEVLVGKTPKFLLKEYFYPETLYYTKNYQRQVRFRVYVPPLFLKRTPMDMKPGITMVVET